MSRRTVQSTGRPGVRMAFMAALFVATAAGLTVGTAIAQAPAANEVLLVVKHFEIVGDNPLSAAQSEAALAPHLGEHRSLGSLEAAATALENRMREDGYSFHRVIVPAQKPVDGVVKLEVLRFPLASVQVTDNQYFSAANILRSLPGLTPGESPDVDRVSRQLGLANDHPSKRLSIVLKESARADALDAEIRTRDSKPSNFVIGLTANTADRYNTINANTGYTRLTLGYQNTNLFDLDHSMTLSYTTSPDHLSRVKQVGAVYWIPLYGLDTSVQLQYFRSDVSTGSIGLGTSSFNVSGSGEFIGARVTYSLPKYGEITHNVSAAYDDRRFASNLDFSGIATFPSSTQSRPLSFRYNARYDQLWGGVSAYAEHAYNLAGGSDNTDAAYAAARTGATRTWNAFRYGLDASYRLGEWGLSARVRGQSSDQQLIPGEQFGIGGVLSVRGLREREFTGDTGYSVTVEALGPQIVQSVRPLFFVDHGRAWLRSAVLAGTTVDRESAASLGVGVRWNVERRLSFSADAAYVLNGIASSGTIPGTQRGDTKLMLSMFYLF